MIALRIFLVLIFICSSLIDFQMLQQSSYNENGHYFRFFIKDIKENPEMFFVKLIYAFYLLLVRYLTTFILIISIILFFVLFLYYYFKRKKLNSKLPLKYTKRMIRIIMLDYLLFFFIAFLCKDNYFSIVKMLIFITMNPLILILVLLILSPVEKLIFNKYKKTALDKLSRMQDIRVIGITGSFGKTSTKMCLESILSQYYKGFYTPKSFNTPNGIVMTLNNETSIFNDYFICEMGAKRVGEINELCSLVHPKYAILTSIGYAHLESFKTIENITKTKFELIESLPSDGICILNKDDSYQTSYEIKSECKKVWISINEKADVYATNIEVSEEGTKFSVNIKGEKAFKVSTVLLGKKNIYNILSSIALAYHLGEPIKNIKDGVKEISPITHRLEIRKDQGFTILDDSFNSNPEGCKNAVDTLSLMKGLKVIITPGMVEMGDKEDELNHEFGKDIANVCDEVYLVGPKHTKPIYEGLIEAGFDKEHIHIYNSFKEGFNDILKIEGKKTVLIENDLPDSYTEA